MPSRTLLRTLIVAEIGTMILASVVSLRTESSLPEPLRAFMKAEAERDITGADAIVAVGACGYLLLSCVSSVGLFVFWRPARILYPLTIGLGMVLTPLCGPYVDTGWADLLSDTSFLISGMIIVCIYFTPLKDLYQKRTVVTAGEIPYIQDRVLHAAGMSIPIDDIHTVKIGYTVWGWLGIILLVVFLLLVAATDIGRSFFVPYRFRSLFMAALVIKVLLTLTRKNRAVVLDAVSGVVEVKVPGNRQEVHRMSETIKEALRR